MTPGVAQPEERIGKYRVHPAAAMFPMLDGQAWEDFCGSIEAYGLLKPIVVQGDLLIDGRNRLRACLQGDIEPRFVEYNGPLDVVDYILISNVDRRDLTDDQRTSICTQIRAWRIARDNATKQAAQADHGTEGGRGKKKTLEMNSSPGFIEPKTRAKDARSTVGQIAQAANVSHHKAAQAVAVAKAAPDLLEQVANGAMKLKDAFIAVKAAAPPRPPRKAAKPTAFNVEKRVRSCVFKVSTLIAQCPASKRPEFKSLLLKECKRLCEK